MTTKTFSHGIHPEDKKEITADKAIERLPYPPRIILFLSQHIGKPAKAVVNVGDEVTQGMMVAEADGIVSAPIFSPVNGVVKALANALDQDGKLAPAIFIEPSAEPAKKFDDFKLDALDDLSVDEIIKRIREAGLVGLGGAAFPTHVKYTIPEGKKVDTFIANGCECEPYLTSDYRIMLERPEDVILGVRYSMKALGVARAIIGIEDNKPEAIAALRKAVAGVDGISVEVCKTKYPQGAEKMLIKALLGREVPSGGLPADVGVVCANVTTLAEIASLVPAKRGLFERVVTVTGGGVESPGNYIIPVGTPLSFILEHVGLTADTYEVIFGGPMMGKTVSYLGTPTTKGTSGIVVLTRPKLGGKIVYNEIHPCIRCGDCLRACPMKLNPSQLGRLGRKNRYEEMADKYHLNDCFECGCCSFTCTAQIPLVQQFRIAKQVLRERRR
ncbi:MAG: electron transport complex subunit RsxC [Bdellovibrionota bacterium]|jgi:electron transport complex protein RnfC